MKLILSDEMNRLRTGNEENAINMKINELSN